MTSWMWLCQERPSQLQVHVSKNIINKRNRFCKAVQFFFDFLACLTCGFFFIVLELYFWMVIYSFYMGLKRKRKEDSEVEEEKFNCGRKNCYAERFFLILHRRPRLRGHLEKMSTFEYQRKRVKIQI